MFFLSSPHRREVRATVTLALPLVIGQLSSVAMTVVDTLLAGHHGSNTLAAVAVGSALWSVAFLLIIGVMMAVPPSVAQLHGAGHDQRIGPLFRQALWLALMLGSLLTALLHASEPLLIAIGIADTVRPEALRFILAVSWGAPALAMYFACRYVSEGVAWTRPTMLFGIGGLLLLLPLGYLLMFGGLGLAARGAGGLGMATALVLWLQLLGFLLYLWRSPRFADLALFARRDWPQWATQSELLRLGLPMGVSIFMEGGLFVATALIIGGMGTVAVAAHQIALNLASVSFMLPLGVAMATTVRIGHAAGRGDRQGIRAAGRAGYQIVLLTQLFSASVLLFGNDFIARLYTDDAAVFELAATLMLYAAAFQFSDGLQALSNGALRGLKDTRVPMLYTLFAYWCVGMASGWWLGKGLGLGAEGMWWGLILGLSVAAVLLTVRFWRLTAGWQPAMEVATQEV